MAKTLGFLATILCFGFGPWEAMAQVVPANCQQVKKGVDFTCQVPGCTQKIKVDKCQGGTTSDRVCDSCVTTQPCCGTEVCSAAQGVQCPDDSGPGIPLPLLRELFGPHLTEPTDLYVPTCAGRFIPLAHALRVADIPE